MAPRGRCASWLSTRHVTAAVLWLGLAGFPPLAIGADTPLPSAAPKLPAALEKPAPESIEDLKAIQAQVRAVVEKVVPCTVGVRIGQAQGSGVIIKDGYVLTAAHVSGPADRNVKLVLHDGREINGKTLGANHTIDSGLIKITTPGTWPHVEMGNSEALKEGQWCVSVGHPGGYRKGRTPVVRLGRVQWRNKNLIRTDCTLVGGDSGGPLFDMNGNVVGIHSRIGIPLAQNIHVPVDTYRETWDRLAKGEVWGNQPGRAGVGTGWLGAKGKPENKDCRITGIEPNSPAEKAGLKVDDVVTKMDGQKVTAFEQLMAEIRKKRAGQSVTLEVLRGKETMTLKVVLSRQERERPRRPPESSPIP